MKRILDMLFLGLIALMVISFSDCNQGTSTNNADQVSIAIDTDIVYLKAPEKDLMLDIYWHSQCVYPEEALTEKGIEVELITIEGGGHGGPGFRKQYERIETFFNKHPKN